MFVVELRKRAKQQVFVVVCCGQARQPDRKVPRADIQRVDSFADRIRCNDFQLLGVLDHHGGTAAAGQIDVSAGCDR